MFLYSNPAHKKNKFHKSKFETMRWDILIVL